MNKKNLKIKNVIIFLLVFLCFFINSNLFLKSNNSNISSANDLPQLRILNNNSSDIISSAVFSFNESTEISSSEISSASEFLSDLASSKVRPEIDNEWAFVLVNQKNPLPDDFKINTKEVKNGFLMDERMVKYIINMIEDSKKDGIDLKVVSTYRTIEYQKKLFNENISDCMTKGYSYEEAYKEVAKNIALPGQSEHNLGLAVDILTKNVGLSEAFKDTEAFKWLDKNAYKYGFILRYDKDKTEITKIVYEPWHFRFIGLYHAKKIKESELCLEEYFEKFNNKENEPF